MSNTIGIVTISFNQSDYIREALSSVLTSAENINLSYIVVDAGSKDGSRDIILEYSSNIEKILFEADDGPADGLNKGFNICKGEIFGYLNSDDKYLDGTFDYVIKFFNDNPDIDILLGAVAIINSDGKLLPRRRLSSSFTMKEYLQGHALAMQQATFFRKNMLDRTTGFNVENQTCWDAEILIDMLISGGRLKVVNKVLGCFRIHENSITGSEHLNIQYKLDQKRIHKKILDTGLIKDPNFIIFLKRINFKFNPIRRIFEYLVPYV